MSLVAEVQLVCNVAERPCIFLDQLLGVFDLHLQYELIGTQANGLLEKPSEVICAEMNHVCHVHQSDVEVKRVVSKQNYLHQLSRCQPAPPGLVHRYHAPLPRKREKTEIDETGRVSLLRNYRRTQSRKHPV